MPVTLHQLFQSIAWRVVAPELQQCYSCKEKELKVYKTIFEKLQQLMPTTSDLRIVLSRYTETLGGETSEIIEVSGENGNLMPESFQGLEPAVETVEKESFALEYTPWSEWLAMTIDPDTLSEFKPGEIVAHCLYEMTFAGFSEEEITSEWKTFEEQINDASKSDSESS